MKKILFTVLVLILGLNVYQADAAFTHIQTPANTADCGSATSCPLAFGSNTGVNNLLIACVAVGNIGIVPAVTDTQGNFWKLASSTSNVADVGSIYTLYSTTSQAAADTVTANISGGNVMRMSISEFSGQAAGDPIDKVASTTGTASAPASGNVTPSQDGELIYACTRNASGVTYTAGTDFTLRAQIPAAPNTRLVTESYVQPTAVIHNGDFGGSSTNWAAQVVTFKSLVSNTTPSCVNRRACLFKRLSLRARLCLSRSCPPNPSANVTSGLVGWWKFDEGSGSTAADSSGSGNTATSNNGATFTTGKIGPFAASFDGINDFFHVPANSAFYTAFPYSITGWVKTTDTTNTVIAEVNQNTGWSWQTFSTGTRPSCLFLNLGGTGVDGSGPSTCDGNWHHYAIVATSAANTKTYIDGVDKSNVIAGGTPSYGTGSLDFGSRAGAAAWPGSLDDFRIYNRALTASEVTTIYNYR